MRRCLPPTASPKPQNHRDPNTKSSPGPWNKRDSAYRLGFVVIEYRWHPLYGKRLPLYRRTKVRGGEDVVHVKASKEVPHELPSWMTDASVCGRMELGPPQVSISALIELREALKAAIKTTSDQGFVSSEDREGESDETASKAIVPAVAASQLRDENSIGRENARGSNQSSRRSVAGSNRRPVGRGNGGHK
jgi:hypothetical protein